MHWTEVVALLIVILALVPVLFLIGYIVAFVWSGLRLRNKWRRLDLGREYRCEQGLFVRKEHGWVAEQDIGGACLTIDVRDDHGSPDAVFLRRLPEIIADLHQLERAARERVLEVKKD
jgi:hypothetical protein